MEFTTKISQLYRRYVEKIPLDLKNANATAIQNWKKNHMLNILEYSRIVAFISEKNNLSELYSCDFDFDMDNIIPVIDSLEDEGVIKFTNELNYNIFIKKTTELYEETNIQISSPDHNYNQFPCDLNSRKKRVDLLINEFHFVTNLNVGLLGDDDLLSIDLAKIKKFNPIVYEIDENIIKTIKKYGSPKIKITSVDISKIQSAPAEKILDTFIVDPPYNHHGIICFVLQGIIRLRSFNEFYLIANQMMLGKKAMSLLLADLLLCNIRVRKLIPSFSKYMFPRNFREYFDFIEYFSNKGITITHDCTISSSSSLFVFDVSEVDLNAVDTLLQRPYFIYQRYNH